MPDAGDLAAEQLAARGVLLVSGPLDDEVASTAAARILAMATPGATLSIRLTNVTGSVSAALMLVDVITGSGALVTATASGMLDTAGAIVLQAARSTGERGLSPRARIHLGQVREPATAGLDLERAAAEVELLRDQAEAALGCRLDRPRMLSAEDAVAAGLADRVESRPG